MLTRKGCGKMLAHIFLIPLDYSKHLKIDFIREKGIDGGGLTCEFFLF